MEEVQSRRRINLKQTSKGIVYWDITVELFNKSNDDVLAEMMDLKKKVEAEIKFEG